MHVTGKSHIRMIHKTNCPKASILLQPHCQHVNLLIASTNIRQMQ